MTDTPTLLAEAIERVEQAAIRREAGALRDGRRMGLTTEERKQCFAEAMETATVPFVLARDLLLIISALRQSQEREAGMREALRLISWKVRHVSAMLIKQSTPSLAPSLVEIADDIDQSLSLSPTMEPNDAG